MATIYLLQGLEAHALLRNVSMKGQSTVHIPPSTDSSELANDDITTPINQGTLEPTQIFAMILLSFCKLSLVTVPARSNAK